MTDNIVLIASKMYGISLTKSRNWVEQCLREKENLSEKEILKIVGEKSLFYLAPAH